MADQSTQKKVSIYGLGNFGYAFLKHFDRKKDDVMVYGLDGNPKLNQNLKKNKKHLTLYQDYTISEEAVIARDPEELLENCHTLVLSVPSTATREAVRNIKPYIPDGLKIVNTAKALDIKTGKRLSQIIDEELAGLQSHVV